jgi:hypothetical protein
VISQKAPCFCSGALARQRRNFPSRAMPFCPVPPCSPQLEFKSWFSSLGKVLIFLAQAVRIVLM